MTPKVETVGDAVVVGVLPAEIKRFRNGKNKSRLVRAGDFVLDSVVPVFADNFDPVAGIAPAQEVEADVCAEYEFGPSGQVQAEAGGEPGRFVKEVFEVVQLVDTGFSRNFGDKANHLFGEQFQSGTPQEDVASAAHGGEVAAEVVPEENPEEISRNEAGRRQREVSAGIGVRRLFLFDEPGVARSETAALGACRGVNVPFEAQVDGQLQRHVYLCRTLDVADTHSVQVRAVDFAFVVDGEGKPEFQKVEYAVTHLHAPACRRGIVVYRGFSAGGVGIAVQGQGFSVADILHARADVHESLLQGIGRRYPYAMGVPGDADLGKEQRCRGENYVENFSHGIR